MAPDHINAAFEFAGGVFTWLNVRRVYKDKGYAGITIPAIIFFFSWGGWNLYFYPHLNQPWSFHAGLFLFAANMAWVTLMGWYGPVQRKDW